MTGFFDPISTARLVGEGDPSATREVLQRVRRLLAFRGYGIPEEDRDDLEQVVMTQIWTAVRRPGFDQAGFWGFVEVVVSRRCIDWLRIRKTETRHDGLDGVADPSLSPLGNLLKLEKIELAQETLTQLPEACRQLIELVVGQRKSYCEAALILGRSEGALRVQMYRCIREARNLLAEILKATGP